MLLVPCTAHYLRRPTAWAESFSVAMLLVLVWDPLALLQMSAWLSFLAVAALLIGLQGRPRGRKKGVQRYQHLLLLWVKPQWVVALALAPLLWYMGVPGNPASILVNIVAIPLVSLALLPGLIAAVFITVCFPFAVGDWWFSALNQGFALLEAIMQWGGAFQTQMIPTPASILVFAFFAALVLMPSGLPGKRMAMALMLGIFATHQLWPKEQVQGLQLFVLDVGQGQAILVHQDNHWLLIDSGPGLVDQGGQFFQVIVPFLRRQGVSKLDMVVFSHHDNDHIGGMKRSPEWIESPLWLFGEPEMGLQGCYAGQEWQLGAMTVSVLSPFSGVAVSGNSASCVVQVRSDDGCILIPGDIDKLAEYRILASRESFARCDLLVASHHGSSSSTSQDWLATFQPELMVISAGRDNRFGHPTLAVKDTLSQFGIPWRSTHLDGTLAVTQLKGRKSIDVPTNLPFYWQSGW